MTSVEMPKANENMAEATLERWLVREGQAVTKDQELCVIINEKATFPLPAPEAGTVLRLLAHERSVLPVGYVLCALGEPGEPVPAELEARNQRTLAAHRGATLAVAPSQAATTIASAGASAVRATPAARRVAKAAGVDLAAVVQTLSLTGPVNEKDVQEFLKRNRHP